MSGATFRFVCLSDQPREGETDSDRLASFSNELRRVFGEPLAVEFDGYVRANRSSIQDFSRAGLVEVAARLLEVVVSRLPREVYTPDESPIGGRAVNLRYTEIRDD